MEQIESPTTPNQIENPQLVFQTPPSSPPPPFSAPLPDPDPSFSVPDQTAQDDDHDNNLHEEMQNQLNLTDSIQEYDNWDDYPQVEEEKEEVKSEESYKRSELFYGNGGEKVGGDDNVDEEEKKNERTSNGYNGNNTSSNSSYHQYPVRPEAEDCAFYMKTGTCKFGSNCKFNHPVRRKNQAVKEKVNEREEATEKPMQTECKYYLRTGGCKYGKACRYSHSRAKTSMPPVKTLASPILELNFLGLPIRSGEKECEYYMRNGSCKYGVSCKYNHPDPTAVGGSDLPPSTFVNGGSAPLQAPSQSSIGSWPSPRALNEAAPFVPMVFSPIQGVPPQSPEWNGYQAPLYPPERSLHPPPSYVMSNPLSETNAYAPQQQQIVVDEFPERPGQPQCSFFMKFGDCKFKSNCKYHHPKNRISKSPPPLTLSDKGLPLRPDQNICSHYSRYGICKFGPACKFDHSMQPSSSTVSGDDQLAAFGNSATQEEARVDESGHGSDTAIEQPV